MSNMALAGAACFVAGMLAGRAGASAASTAEAAEQTSIQSPHQMCIGGMLIGCLALRACKEVHQAQAICWPLLHIASLASQCVVFRLPRSLRCLDQQQPSYRSTAVYTVDC